MKTIPVSLVFAALLAPVWCQPAAPAAKPENGPPKDMDGAPPRKPGPTFEEIWKRTDKDQNGFISKDEFFSLPRMQKLPEEKREKVFARFDKDNDGKLSRAEMEEFREKRAAGPPMRRIWELDTDQSGGVSIAEFKLGEVFNKMPPEKAEAIFKRLDTDGDGQITPKDRPEPRGGRDGKPGGPPESPEEIGKRLDTNRDGAVSFEEFRADPKVKDLPEDEQEDRFEKLDRNKDLKLTPEDFAPPQGAAPEMQ